MSDLISRAAAIDALVEELAYKPEGYWDSGLNRYDVEVVLNQQPSVDAVEIVRCRDCKHYQFADNRAFGFPVKRCEWTGFEDVDDEDFCSRGEWKDGERHGTDIR